MDNRTQHHKELEEKIAEVSATVDEMRAELEKERESEQHEAIEKLDQYIEEAHIKLSDLRTFWHEIMRELRGEK